MKNIQIKDVIFTPEDMTQLFKMEEQLREIYENISKGCAIVAIASEAIESNNQKGTEFTGSIMLDAVNAVFDYVYVADKLSAELYNKFQEMYSKKRNHCYGGEVV